MKAMILFKDGTYKVDNIICKGSNIEVASWEIVNDYITSTVENKEKTIMGIYNDVLGYNFTGDEEPQYRNRFAMKVFNTNFPIYGTVVIIGRRMGKNCDIRNKDVDYIRGLISEAI